MATAASPKNEVIFGWSAPPMVEQHPALDAEVAAHFDKDNAAIIRLSVRGVITSAERASAFKRLTKQIERDLRAALRPSQAS